MSKKFSGHSSRHGLTLVEVVAGIALLSTLLVAILMSYAAHAGQIRLAHKRIQAIQAAERLLTEWTASGNLPIVGDKDIIPEADGLAWRMVPAAGASSGSLPVQLKMMRLEVYERSDAERVLTSVELFSRGSELQGTIL